VTFNLKIESASGGQGVMKYSEAPAGLGGWPAGVPVSRPPGHGDAAGGYRDHHDGLGQPLLSVNDQSVVSLATSIVSLRPTFFVFSAEEIRIVATEDLLMNA
jgi:hypothetical protein